MCGDDEEIDAVTYYAAAAQVRQGQRTGKQANEVYRSTKVYGDSHNKVANENNAEDDLDKQAAEYAKMTS